MSLKSNVEKVANEAISISPAVQSGWVIDTASLINKTIDEPGNYFLTLNNMSAIDGYQLKLDYAKSGQSVFVKELGVSRAEKYFVNPKQSSLLSVGNISGKVGEYNSEGSNATADIIFSGNNNQLATIVGMQMVPRRRDIQNMTAPKEVADASIEPIENVGATGASIGLGTSLPNELDTKTGKPLKESKYTPRGPYGNAINTGTIRNTITEIGVLVTSIGVY